jgi:alkanesulfonate monooxygenase SsuD/methylene tetrahydromethanopterin reductase-like flavin-dependent oxidoreductase (luciferase family)
MLAALEKSGSCCAHALATIDVISKGRVLIGVSVGRPCGTYIQRQVRSLRRAAPGESRAS